MTLLPFSAGGSSRTARSALSPTGGRRQSAPMVIDRNLGFVHPANVQAMAYWQSKCGTRAMPARADLDPLEMRGFLANVALVDVLPREGRPSGFRIRLAGAAIEDVFGPVSARLLTDAVPAETAARWARMFQAAIDARALKYFKRCRVDRCVLKRNHILFPRKAS